MTRLPDLFRLTATAHMLRYVMFHRVVTSEDFAREHNEFRSSRYGRHQMFAKYCPALMTRTPGQRADRTIYTWVGPRYRDWILRIHRERRRRATEFVEDVISETYDYQLWREALLPDTEELRCTMCGLGHHPSRVYGHERTRQCVAFLVADRGPFVDVSSTIWLTRSGARCGCDACVLDRHMSRAEEIMLSVTSDAHRTTWAIILERYRADGLASERHHTLRQADAVRGADWWESIP